MSIKKNKNQLIISIIVGVAIAVISYQVIIKLKIDNDNLRKLTESNMNAPVKNITYVVSKVDVKKGEVIDPKNLASKRFPVEIEGAVTDTSRIEGLVAKRAIKADSAITEDDFKLSDIDIASTEPRMGYSAVNVTLAEDHLPQFVKEGSFVDLYSEKDTIRVKNVRILSINDSSSGGLKNVMLEIREKDVPCFIRAIVNDKTVFVQRNKLDDTGYKFIANAGILTQEIPDIQSSSSNPPELVEISDISTDEPPRREIQPRGSSSIPVVKSNMHNVSEIEFITGDKKMIVGAP